MEIISELEKFTADVAHELKNPLASLKMSNELLAENKIKSDDRKLLFSNIVKDLDVTTEEMEYYFKNRWKELGLADVDTTRFYKYEEDVYNAILYEKHQKLVDEKLVELKKKYPVWINTNILDTLKISDSYKDIQTSLLVRKSFTGEASMPTVDMQWISF